MGILCGGMCISADEVPSNRQCSGIDSRYECGYLGELTDSVSAAGDFGSCTASAGVEPLTSGEDLDSTIVYQFDAITDGRAKLVINGMGNAWVFRDGIQVFRMDSNVTSVERRFVRGRYTLVGHAPFCKGSLSNWNGGYRFDIDAEVRDVSERDTSGTAADTDRMVVTNPENKKHPLVRTAKWTFIVLSTLILIAIGGFLLAENPV